MAFKLKYHWVVITDTKNLVRISLLVETWPTLGFQLQGHALLPLPGCVSESSHHLEQVHLVSTELSQTSSSCYEQLWQFVLQPTKVPYRSFHKALRFRSSREAISRVYIPILQKGVKL
ncbi:hypothetical protein FOZ63_008126 [Perkinsus olseni]|uniref:Uncharacterized protein n=1 Tax=Perkinsus olseni TaxID=32597 RepID=A0A7J6RD96_PEROL|nr:hypothetical protein FOZ63_008126 [Perkinsus olseni]